VKLIGLDIGDRRIGIAFGDSALRLATPVDVLVRVHAEQDARGLTRFVHEYEAEAIIVGLPRNMDGTIGPQAEATRAYAEQIAARVQVPVRFWDERLTTVEAARRKEETGPRQGAGQGSRKDRRGKKTLEHLDAIAAAVILQDYIDAQANESTEKDVA
jgi:putative Holliday junction resolvase